VVDQARDEPIASEPSTDGSKESAETKPSRPAGRLVEVAIIGLVVAIFLWPVARAWWVSFDGERWKARDDRDEMVDDVIRMIRAGEIPDLKSAEARLGLPDGRTFHTGGAVSWRYDIGSWGQYLDLHFDKGGSFVSHDTGPPGD
jgi:hypothetical protein